MWLVLILAMLVGCGGEGDSPGPDTGFDGAGDTGAADSGPVSPTPLTPLAAPQLPEWPCPEGWREVSARDIAPGLSRCEPWPEDETPCAIHEVRLPGDPACRALGPECPADGWPAALPDAGVVYVRSMTTAEEEILVTERLQRQGIAIDMILSKCIVTPGINTLDLLSGDRTHILYYLRAISYGPVYKFSVRMSDGSQQEVEANVGELEIKGLPEDFQEPFAVQHKGVTYELRLSRGHDEQTIIRARLQNDAKMRGQATEIGGTQSLTNLIVSVNGDEDKKIIKEAVKKMPVMTASVIRKKLIEMSPGPVLIKSVLNERTGTYEDISISVSETFFRTTD